MLVTLPPHRSIMCTPVALKEALTVDPARSSRSSADLLVIRATSGKPQSIPTRTRGPEDAMLVIVPENEFLALVGDGVKAMVTPSGLMQAGDAGARLQVGNTLYHRAADADVDQALLPGGYLPLQNVLHSDKLGNLRVCGAG